MTIFSSSRPSFLSGNKRTSEFPIPLEAFNKTTKPSNLGSRLTASQVPIYSKIISPRLSKRHWKHYFPQLMTKIEKLLRTLQSGVLNSKPQTFTRVSHVQIIITSFSSAKTILLRLYLCTASGFFLPLRFSKRTLKLVATIQAGNQR